MSAFKPPKDAPGPGPQGKPENSPPRGPQPAPAPPPVVVTRSIDVGGPARQGQGQRPVAPSANIGPPPARPAPAPAPAPPAAAPAPKTPTLRLESPSRLDAPPPSVRPPAPTIGDEGMSASIADTFERLLASDVDQGFDAIMQPSPASARAPGAAPAVPAPVPTPSAGLLPTDLSEVRGLFEQLASSYLRPVRDFLMDLRWGEATVDWVDVCEPSLRSLRRAAEKLELPELCAGLDALSATLAAAKASPSKAITGDRRAAILATHEKLATLMPQAFALDLDRSRRESVILQGLLLQVPEVKKVTIDKLYAAGVTTLEAMLLATPADLVAAAGIDVGLATLIVAKFREHRAQVQAGVPDATHAQERAALAQLATRLRRVHDEYERVSSGWSREDGARKKELRAVRERTLLDVQVLLGRLGEVEKLKELERLPFERKVAHLEAFLEEARDRYKVQS